MPTTRLSNIGWLELSTPAIALAVMSPLIIMVSSAALSDSAETLVYLWNTVLDDYVLNSLLLMFGVCTLTLLFGVPTAWLTSVCEFPGHKAFAWLLLLPLAFPAYIIAYTYTGILDYSGPIFTFIRETAGREVFDLLYVPIRSVPGAILMLSLVLYPYVYLLARTAFLDQSVRFLEVSRTLGYSSKRSFFCLAIPLARPAIVTGVSLALMETLADYGTVAYFGINTFTTGIFKAFYAMDDLAAAGQLSTMLLMFIAMLIFAERQSRRKARYFQDSATPSRNSRIQLKGKHAAWAWLTCLIPVIFGFVLPALVLLKWSVFDAKWETTAFFTLIWHTFYLAFAAALIIVVIGLLLSYAKRRNSSRTIHGLVVIASLGYAIPGAIIAVGAIIPLVWVDHRIIRFAKSILDIEIGLLLTGSILALLFAYTVRFLALSVSITQRGLEKIKPNMDKAAQCLGYRTFEILRIIHLPIMRTSLWTALLLVFVDVLKELPATLILRPFNFNTLAVRAYELASDERLVDAALPSLLIIAAGIVPVILLSRTISQPSRVRS